MLINYFDNLKSGKIVIKLNKKYYFNFSFKREDYEIFLINLKKFLNFKIFK